VTARQSVRGRTGIDPVHDVGNRGLPAKIVEKVVERAIVQLRALFFEPAVL
jgi:hypothetical protein